MLVDDLPAAREPCPTAGRFAGVEQQEGVPEGRLRGLGPPFLGQRQAVRALENLGARVILTGHVEGQAEQLEVLAREWLVLVGRPEALDTDVPTAFGVRRTPPFEVFLTHGLKVLAEVGVLRGRSGRSPPGGRNSLVVGAGV